VHPGALSAAMQSWNPAINLKGTPSTSTFFRVFKNLHLGQQAAAHLVTTPVPLFIDGRQRQHFFMFPNQLRSSVFVPREGIGAHLVTTPVPLFMEMDVSGSTKMRS